MQKKVERWKELSRETVFSKYGREIEKVIYQFPDGTKSDYYIKKEYPVACVLALTKDKKVILSKQYRPGPDEILFDLPGGKIEKGEKIEEGMAREFLEETGYQGKLKKVGKIISCAYSSQDRYSFVATDCEKVGEIKQTSSEFCENVLVSIEELKEIIKKEKIIDIGAAYQGLDYLGLL